MKNKYLRHADDEWLSIINECRSSDDSDRIWRQEHHITLSTFYYQIRRLQKKPVAYIPVPVKSAGRAQEVIQIDLCTQDRYPVPLSAVTSPETAVKIIFLDGFVLMQKRLDASGRFQWPRNMSEARLLTRQDFCRLMEGLSIDQPKAIKPDHNRKKIYGADSPVSGFDTACLIHMTDKEYGAPCMLCKPA